MSNSDLIFVGPKVKLVSYALKNTSRSLYCKSDKGSYSIAMADYQDDHNLWIFKEEEKDVGGRIYYSIRNVYSWRLLYSAYDWWQMTSDSVSNYTKWYLQKADEQRYGKGYVEIINKQTGSRFHTHHQHIAHPLESRCAPNTEFSGQWKVFLVDDVRVINIKYLDPTKKNQERKAFKVFNFNNDSTTSLRPMWEETSSVSVTETNKFAWKSETKMSMSIKANAKIPFIASAKAEMKAETSIALGKENATENNVTKTERFQLPVEVPPMTKCIATVFMTEATASIPFIATLESGGTNWEEEGTYEGVQYGSTDVDVKMIKLD